MAEKPANLKPMGSTLIPAPPLPVQSAEPASPAVNTQRKPLSPVGSPVVKSTLSSINKSNPSLGAAATLNQGQPRYIQEGKLLGKMILNAPVGFVKLFGGASIDVGEILLEAATEGAYQAPNAKNTTYGHFGIGIWNTVSGLATGKREAEYLKAWRENRPISGMIIEDFGNLSILGGAVSHILGAGAQLAATGAAEAGASAEAATAAAEAGGAAEASQAAKYANKASRLTSVSEGLGTAASKLKTFEKVGQNVMMAPLKPWFWGFNGIGQIVRTGNLAVDVTPNLTVGTNFRFWGENAANKFQTQLDNLRASDPTIDATDREYSNLLKKISYHRRISDLQGIKAISRRAVRTVNHEASLMTQAVEEVRQNPLFKNDINPATGELWGELTDAENQAVIAVLNGRAQLVSHLSQLDGVSPGDVADFGKWDYSPGYSLKPEGAKLAVDYLHSGEGAVPHPSVSESLSPEHYDRISHAIDSIAKVLIDLSNKGTEGYGRKSPLHAEYFTPVPFANKLGDALRRSGVKMKSGVPAYEVFKMLEERGYFDLPVDNLQRQNTLAAFVGLLPDEYALDSSMYPATMRENIEFFKRYRRSLRQRLNGVAEGEPMPSNDLPPVGPDEYRMTARKGAPGSVEKFINKTDKAIDKILSKVDDITSKIKVAEKKYKKESEKLQQHDIVDEFIAGRSHQYLARKYHIPIAMVREILDSSPIAKQFNRIESIKAEMEPLEKIIGKTRAATPVAQLETVEMQKMQTEYNQLLQELQDANKKIKDYTEVNETIRTSQQNAISDAAEELSNLDDSLGDAEQELINAGGNPDLFITKEDISDPNVMPMTPGQTKAFFESVINHIDNELSPFVEENMPEVSGDLKRSKILLIDTWNRAEKFYFDAEGEWQDHAASVRMVQIGNMYRELETSLSSALDPQTAVQSVLDILTNKNTLDIISGAKRPSGLQLPRTASSVRRVTIFEKTDLTKYVDLRQPAMVDAVYEDLKDPSVVADLFGASPYGNTARMAEAASQLIRWIKEVKDATAKQKIALILDPPAYVDMQLARKLLSGMTRKLSDIPNADVTHPINVFNRRVISEAMNIIHELEDIEVFYKTYGERPIYVDWKAQGELFTERNGRGGEHQFNRLAVQFSNVSIRVLDGVNYESPTVPEISFRSHTPAQVVIKGIEAVIESIKADVGSNIRADEFKPGWFDGYYLKVKGLTRKLGKYADRAIADLEFIKSNIESKAKPVVDDFFLDKNSPRLAGVYVKQTGELVGREQFNSFKDFSSEFVKQVKDIHEYALENNGWEGWKPEELLHEANIIGEFSKIFESHKYEIDNKPLDQKIFDFHNSLNREDRQIFFDSLSHMRDYITDEPRTKQNVKSLTTLDAVIDFLTNGKFKGTPQSGLSIIERSVEESQSAATGAITARFKKLNEKSDFVIIPCGNTKLGTSAPASEFYTGSMFQDALRTARKLYTDDRIYVLSAKHGLVTLDQVLEPYDLKLGDPGSIDAGVLAKQMDKFGIEGTVTSLMPKMYDKLFTEAAGSKVEIDHHFEGTRGIGDQKARLSKLRDSAPETIAAPDIPKNMQGSIELSGELEQTASLLANDADSFQQFKEDTANAHDLIKYLDEIKNPTIEDLSSFKAVYTDRLQTEVNDIKGYMESNLGGEWDRGTDKVTFYVTPVKGQPEWDWWFALDGKERRYIALQHFSSTEIKTGYGRGGPTYIRKAQGIDVIADSANMTPDEWGAAMVENVRQLRSSKNRLSEAVKTKTEDYKGIYVDENLPEASAEEWKFTEQNNLSPEEVLAITDRVNFLTQRDVSTIDVPYKLRDVADSPDQVEYDMRIRNVNVRDAAYETDLIDSMAKEATKKMKAAERFSDRIQALQEFIDKSKIHDARVEKLLKQRAVVEKTRLRQIDRGEKISGLKEERAGIRKEASKLRAVIKKVKTNPDFERLTGSDGSLPLRLALNENVNYPSEGRSVIGPNGENINLTGPMYVPTGKPGEITGGIRTEITREGLSGYQRAGSEYYRDGDRHTIFSIRLLAKRIESDVRRMASSEAYKAIVAQFGNKPLEVLGQSRIDELQKQAEQIALNYPIDRLHNYYDQIVREAEAAGEPLTDGIAAYSSGARDPIASFKLVVQNEFGKLIVAEMESKTLRAIDPYRSITSTMRTSSVNEQTMFVPDHLRESIAAIEIVINPGEWHSILRGMNKITSKFKTGTLALSISWQMGDLLTNVLLATMTGVPLPEMLRQMNMVRKIEYGKGLTGLKNMFDPREQRPIDLTPEEYTKVRIAKESPVQDISIQSAQRRSLEGLKPDVEKSTKLNRLTSGNVDYPEILKGRSLVKVSFKLNETINRITRHAYFFSQLEKILTENGTTLDEVASNPGSWRFEPAIKKAMEDAADTANKWLGDFSDLSMFERKYIVGQVPFYAWIKHIHKVFLAMGREHPQSLAWYIYMGNFMFDPNDDPLGLRYGGVNFFGGVASVNTFSPFADVVNGPVGSMLLDNDPRAALNSLGPVPRLVAGLGFGLDISKLEKIQRPAGTGQYTDTGIASGGSLLPIVPGGSFTQAAGFTLNQFPIAKRVLQILPGHNIPGTDIALGPTNTYLTGEARLDPITRQRVNKWGNTGGAIARLFSVPLIPFKTNKQIQQATISAQMRLASVDVLKRIKKAQGVP